MMFPSVVRSAAVTTALLGLALAAGLLVAPHTAGAAEPVASTAPAVLDNVTSAALAQMATALPTEAMVTPRQPRRLLIYTATRGFRHSSIETGATAFRMMGERTGAYTATITDDPEAFAPDRLARFDAVLLMNTTGPAFLPADFDALTSASKTAALARDAALKASLLAFVERGGGLVGAHSATDTFHEWPEYATLIGGKFVSHPWHEQVHIELVEPEHPLLASFEGQPLVVTDEIYQFGEEFRRENLRLLLRLDPARINRSAPGIARSDDDFGVSWVRRAGQGRVFCNSLGHREEIYWNPRVMRYYLAGVQYALGDFDADDAAR